MSRELEELGGGETRAPSYALHVVVDERLRPGESQTVWKFDGAVGLQDPSTYLDQPKVLGLYLVVSIVVSF
jgi:hypothetical protein